MAEEQSGKPEAAQIVKDLNKAKASKLDKVEIAEAILDAFGGPVGLANEIKTLYHKAKRAGNDTTASRLAIEATRLVSNASEGVVDSASDQSTEDIVAAARKLMGAGK